MHIKREETMVWIYIKKTKGRMDNVLPSHIGVGSREMCSVSSSTLYYQHLLQPVYHLSKEIDLVLSRVKGIAICIVE
jgi:hypothetical protein